MAAKTFEQVLDEVRGKPILVANRGIPARRICRAIRERFAAVPVMTATDIDKAAPAASSAQEHNPHAAVRNSRSAGTY